MEKLILIKIGEESREDSKRGAYYERVAYRLGAYKVIQNLTVCRDYCCTSIQVYTGEGRFLPEIEFCGELEGQEAGQFKIQTVAHGALEAPEIIQLMDGYNAAIQAVAVLNHAFCEG